MRIVPSIPRLGPNSIANAYLVEDGGEVTVIDAAAGEAHFRSSQGRSAVSAVWGRTGIQCRWGMRYAGDRSRSVEVSRAWRRIRVWVEDQMGLTTNAASRFSAQGCSQLHWPKPWPAP